MPRDIIFFLYYRAFVVLLLLLTGCAVPSLEDRRLQSELLVEAAGWSEINLPTEQFDFTGFVPVTEYCQSKLLTIYIEGDGLAFITRSRISADPTPIKPVGLMLALRHPDKSVAYLARPCQFGQTRNCSKRYWTSGRFAPEVIVAFNQAINLLKKRYKAEHLHLVGYSGGGAVAALVAAGREDVTLLVTVAGNLDHAAWTAYHQVSALHDSLNAKDAWAQLLQIPQIHYLGKKDENITLAVVQSFVDQFPEKQRPEIRIVDGMSHGCCWEDIWPIVYLR
jgi:hypothetical protein